MMSFSLKCSAKRSSSVLMCWTLSPGELTASACGVDLLAGDAGCVDMAELFAGCVESAT